MRTTLELDDELLEQARREAEARGQTLDALIAQGLHWVLAKAKPAGPRRRVELPVSDARGLRPGIDLSNSAKLLEIMEEGLPLEKLR